MTEVYMGAKFLVEKVSTHHEFIDLFGKVTMGGISIGMKSELNGKTMEIINIYVNSSDSQTVVITIKGADLTDFSSNQILDFAPIFS